MNALAKLQQVSFDDSKPYHGFAKLPIGYHKILCFRTVKNKFTKKVNNESEKSILVELTNEVVFLPQYFANRLNNEDIAELNSIANDAVYLYFGGRREANK